VWQKGSGDSGSFEVDRLEVNVKNSPELEYSRGDGTITTVHKFGFSDVVTNTESDVWEVGGDYTGFFEQAQSVFVISGGNAQDSQAISGTGAWTVIVQGLDDDFRPVADTLTLNGGTQSAVTSNSYRRVFRAYVDACGTYGGTNEGNITLAGTVASGTMARIVTGVGQTQQAVYCIPSGATGYLTQFHVDVAGTKAANIRLYQRSAAHDTSSPYIAKRLVMKMDDVTGHVMHELFSYPKFTGPCDLWCSAEKTSAGTVEVTATFDLFIEND
jgi:hypothetical protein